MNRLTDEQIAELRRLEKDATEGPWEWMREKWLQEEFASSNGAPVSVGDLDRRMDGNKRETVLSVAPNKYGVATVHGWWLNDMLLIPAMRNALPALLDEVEKGRKAIAVLKRINRRTEWEDRVDIIHDCNAEGLDPEARLRKGRAKVQKALLEHDGIEVVEV